MVKARMDRSEDRENVRSLHVEVEPETIKRHLDAAFNKLRREVSMPGFRKGRVPRSLFERRFGTEVLWEEALEDMVSEAYSEAVAELELEPIAPPKIDLGDTDESGLQFTAEVEVMPSVKLGPYEDISVELEMPDITDEDVDEMLHNLRESRASIVVVEDEDAELAPGYLAVCDFAGYHDGELIEQLQGEEAMVEVGAPDNLPGFDDALTGAKAGEKREFTSELPEDFPLDECAGKEVTFTVEIKEIKEKDLPELDDEFVQEEFDQDSVSELREVLKEQLIHRAEEGAISEFEQSVIEKAVEMSELEVPESMVESALDDMVQNMQQRLQSQEMAMEDYLASRGFESEDDLREDLHTTAEEQVRQMLVLEAIAEQEEIEVEDEDLESEMQGQANSFGLDAGALRQIAMQNPEYLNKMKNEIRIRKSREFLATQSDPEYDGVKQRMQERQEKWRQEFMQKQAEAAETEAAEAEITEEEDSPVKEEQTGEA